MARKIIHIDMDAFFASVEQRDFPQLRGKPLAVGGNPKGRGVVAAASYEARRFGVRSAMPSARAIRQCPQLIFVKPRFEVYRQVSKRIRRIFFSYTDLVEPLSLDEAFLDVTQNHKGIPSATWVAEAVRREIYAATALTASAGVAPNKFLAKVASDINKPNGMYVIPPSQAEAFVAGLPIGKFYGVGKATEKHMHQLGIFNGNDLRRWSQEDLVRHLGKSGVFFYRIARGIDERPVVVDHIRKSVGVEATYGENLTNDVQMQAALKKLAAELERRLRQAETAGKTVTLKCRYPDFTTITRSQTQKGFVKSKTRLYEVARFLLSQTQALKRHVRLLGITVSTLDNQEEAPREIQLPLPFGDTFF